jgi:hypothetical protein
MMMTGRQIYFDGKEESEMHHFSILNWGKISGGGGRNNSLRTSLSLSYDNF